MALRPAQPSETLAPRYRFCFDLGRLPWSTTLLRGLLAALILYWLASHLLPVVSQPAAADVAAGALGLLIALRWLAGLPDGAERARRAHALGWAWPSRLALLLIPAELVGLLRLLAVTADGCLAWLTRRPQPPRSEGHHLEDRRKGFYDGFFALNVVSFVVSIPVMLLFLPPVNSHPEVHIAMHMLEALFLMVILGDRWLVHAGGHVLTPTHLHLHAGARAAARIPLAAIETIELLDEKTSLAAWRRAHGAHHEDTGTVSIMDSPNVAITLQPGLQATWSRFQVERPLPRHLFLYLDDPAALAPAVATAQAQSETFA